MNRQQAKAIVENIELIRHFAAGGEVTHLLHDCNGQFVREYPANGIILGNLHCKPNMTYYKIVKPRYKYNDTYKGYVRL